MPQTAGKPKTKSSSTSKRHFTVVIGTKEHGLYCSSSPSSAARKAVSKLCGKKVKNVEFCLREITQGSKKKTYGPYLGHIEKLAKPIQLKGRLVERMPVARLKPKSSAKKGGMRGGEIEDEFITEFETAVVHKHRINKKDSSTSNNILTIKDLSKKYVGLGLLFDEQQKILLDCLQSKFNNLDWGNDTGFLRLVAKYKAVGLQITDKDFLKLKKKSFDPSDKNLAYIQHMQNKSRLVKVTPSLDTINENNQNS